MTMGGPGPAVHEPTASSGFDRAAGDRSDSRTLPLWCCVLVFVAVTLGFFLLLLTAVLGPHGTLVLDDYLCAIVPAVTSWSCWRASRRCAGRHRRAWLLLGCGVGSWTVGGLAWAVYEVHLDVVVPFPGVPDIGYLGFAPLAVAALVTFPDVEIRGSQLRALLDGTIAAGALLFMSWTILLEPAFGTASGPVFGEVVGLAYPLTDVLTATIALLVVSRARGNHRVTMLSVALGLLLIAVADSLFFWFTARGDYTSGNLLDSGWVAGFLLVGLAAARVRPDADPATPSGAAAETPSRLAVLSPYAPLVVSLPLAVTQQVLGTPLTGVSFYLFLVMILAVLLRQLATVQMNVALAIRLHDTVEALRGQEAALQHQAFHDPLTGLANRALFADRATHALARPGRRTPVILLLADLDDFKAVNDTLGHAAGDALLVSAANRLQGVVRRGETVARLGGDEFAVLLESVRDLVEAEEVATRITEALALPFKLAGTSASVGVSIGIAVGDDRATGEDLLRDADIAMYAAKSEGKGRHAVYAVELAADASRRRELRRDIGTALDAGQLFLKYQPMIDLRTGRLLGVEALLRWQHPTEGEISPVAFIPLAEETGDIVAIGRWVLQEACAQAGRWHDAHDSSPPLQLSVNVSGRQLGDAHLVETVRSALESAGLAPGLLTLEITESLLVEDNEALPRLRELHRLGVRIAIDDFGTGHSALSRLRHYPVDTLKIDRSFIASALGADAEAGDILLATILGLGERLGLDVVAEGVETEDQLETLRSLGCTHGQGFLFARPADADLIETLVRTGAGLTEPAVSSR